jgi:hypothetical protein
MEKEEIEQRKKDDREIPKEGLFEFGSYKNCDINEYMPDGNRNGKKIQDTCVKIEVDRLGNIKPA